MTATLFSHLEKISDPRKARGIRHGSAAILKLVIFGFVARLVCVEHIVDFAHTIWGKIREPLGFTRATPPDATTIRRVLHGINIEELRDAFSKWMGDLVEGKEMVASVDGKALGNVNAEGKDHPLMMLNVFAHDIKMALLQKPLDSKKGEPTVLKEVLGDLFKRYPGLKILVGDAAFSGRDLCQAIIDAGREYVIQIKENQPELKEQLQREFEPLMKGKKPSVVELKKKARKPKKGNFGFPMDSLSG